MCSVRMPFKDFEIWAHFEPQLSINSINCKSSSSVHFSRLSLGFRWLNHCSLHFWGDRWNTALDLRKSYNEISLHLFWNRSYLHEKIFTGWWKLKYPLRLEARLPCDSSEFFGGVGGGILGRLEPWGRIYFEATQPKCCSSAKITQKYFKCYVCIYNILKPIQIFCTRSHTNCLLLPPIPSPSAKKR